MLGILQCTLGWHNAVFLFEEEVIVMVNSLLWADTPFAVKDGHRLFTLSPKTDLHSTISTDCSSIGKVHFNPLLSGSVIAFGSTPIAGVKESLLILAVNVPAR